MLIYGFEDVNDVWNYHISHEIFLREIQNWWNDVTMASAMGRVATEMDGSSLPWDLFCRVSSTNNKYSRTVGQARWLGGNSLASGVPNASLSSQRFISFKTRDRFERQSIRWVRWVRGFLARAFRISFQDETTSSSRSFPISHDWGKPPDADDWWRCAAALNNTKTPVRNLWLPLFS